MKYFLDTNICIFLINGKYPGLNKYFLTRNPSEIFIPSIVLSELVYCIQKSVHSEKNFSKLNVFMSEIETVPFGDKAAFMAGQIRADLDRSGTPIGGNDILIAATTLVSQGVLVTNNTREFSQIKGLALEDWSLN